MSDSSPDRLARLDPDRAATAAAGKRAPPPPRRSLEPRHLRWLVGVAALAVVIGYSGVRLATHGSGTVGVPAGQPVHAFAAPLATSTLVGDADLQPPCALDRHDARALNVCLLVARGPLVLGFFVTDAAPCERAVDAMQAVASTFAAAGVQFAAVAVRADRRAVAAAVRRHRWTIPVAYDRDGAVGQRYGVAACPLLELVRRGGVVARRLIGRHWTSPTALSAQVRLLVRR